jgi:hypothetical protein
MTSLSENGPLHERSPEDYSKQFEKVEGMLVKHNARIFRIAGVGKKEPGTVSPSTVTKIFNDTHSNSSFKKFCESPEDLFELLKGRKVELEKSDLTFGELLEVYRTSYSNIEKAGEGLEEVKSSIEENKELLQRIEVLEKNENVIEYNDILKSAEDLLNQSDVSPLDALTKAGELEDQVNEKLKIKEVGEYTTALEKKDNYSELMSEKYTSVKNSLNEASELLEMISLIDESAALRKEDYYISDSDDSLEYSDDSDSEYKNDLFEGFDEPLSPWDIQFASFDDVSKLLDDKGEVAVKKKFKLFQKGIPHVLEDQVKKTLVECRENIKNEILGSLPKGFPVEVEGIVDKIVDGEIAKLEKAIKDEIIPEFKSKEYLIKELIELKNADLELNLGEFFEVHAEIFDEEIKQRIKLNLNLIHEEIMLAIDSFLDQENKSSD